MGNTDSSALFDTVAPWLRKRGSSGHTVVYALQLGSPKTAPSNYRQAAADAKLSIERYWEVCLFISKIAKVRKSQIYAGIFPKYLNMVIGNDVTIAAVADSTVTE